MSTVPGRQGAPATRLPTRPRDKRPALALLALLLVLLGALGSALLVYRTGERTQVLIASDTIRQGQSVTADDFTVAEIAYEEGAQVVPASALESFVGANSITHIPAGSLISGQMFTPSELAPEGAQLVGVVVPSVGRPADGFQTDDIVRVYSTPGGTGGQTADEAEVLVAAAKVVSAGVVSDTRDTLHVTLLLPEESVAQVIAASAAGSAALAVLPASTPPVVDWRTE